MEDKKFEVGDVVKIASNGVYFTGRQISPLIKSKNWYVTSIAGSRVMLGTSSDGYYCLNAPVDAKYLTKLD